ncbi:MAG: BON domain-containing protein [Enterovibrio sp.]
MKRALFFAFWLNLSACSTVYQQDPRSPSTEWQDNKITVQIAGISNKPFYFGKVRINAVTYQGNVILMGQASTAQLKNAIVKQIKGVPGVKRVFDQVRIMPPITLTQVSYDTWLTTKVKATLIGSKKLINSDIKIVTENNEVFLFGYVKPHEAQEASELVRHVSGVRHVYQAWF